MWPPSRRKEFRTLRTVREIGLRAGGWALGHRASGPVDEVRAIAAEASGARPGDTRRLLKASRRRRATWMVAGEYRHLGERLQLKARLVDSATGEVAARAAADGAAGELFALQDAIGRELTGALVSLASA